MNKARHSHKTHTGKHMPPRFKYIFHSTLCVLVACKLSKIYWQYVGHSSGWQHPFRLLHCCVHIFSCHCMPHLAWTPAVWQCSCACERECVCLQLTAATFSSLLLCSCTSVWRCVLFTLFHCSYFTLRMWMFVWSLRLQWLHLTNTYTYNNIVWLKLEKLGYNNIDNEISYSMEYKQTFNSLIELIQSNLRSTMLVYGGQRWGKLWTFLYDFGKS